MSRKPAIPSIASKDVAVNQVLNAMKENIELITGARPGIAQIPQLASTATTADIISKINTIIARINVTGT